MIVRAAGSEVLLIAQHDHALVAGELARHFGNEAFARPEPFDDVVRAAGNHDAGWRMHDELPTLNRDRRPVDVFSSPVLVSVAMWAESVKQAASQGDYAALLVSLHVLNLSAMAANHPHSNPESFALNKFQQNQVQLQDELRQRLGMRTDLPRRLGLVARGLDRREDELSYNLGVVAGGDQVSLTMCYDSVVFPVIRGMARQVGWLPVPISAARLSAGVFSLSPWPYDRPELVMQLPCRRVPAGAFADEAEFRKIRAAAPVEQLRVVLRSTSM